MTTLLRQPTTRRTALLAVTALLAAACEKEIDIDYHLAPTQYVVEGAVTNTGTTAKVTTTRGMEDNNGEGTWVKNAVVVVSWGNDDDRSSDTLTYEAQGVYRSALRGRPGREYTMTVSIGDERFTSSSVMQRQPQLASTRFVWQKMMTERMLYFEVYVQDREGENNCYFLHLYRNGIGYRWAVLRDNVNPGGELQQLFNCMTERQMKNGSDDTLQEGDRLRLEIRSIDRRTYDYFYSLQVMDNSGTNPLENFTGGCLGYFSAYSKTESNYVFSLNDVEEE